MFKWSLCFIVLCYPDVTKFQYYYYLFDQRKYLKHDTQIAEQWQSKQWNNNKERDKKSK